MIRRRVVYVTDTILLKFVVFLISENVPSVHHSWLEMESGPSWFLATCQQVVSHMLNMSLYLVSEVFFIVKPQYGNHLVSTATAATIETLHNLLRPRTVDLLPNRLEQQRICSENGWAVSEAYRYTSGIPRHIVIIAL